MAMDNFNAQNHNDFNSLIFNSAELFNLMELCRSEHARLSLVKPYNDYHKTQLKELQDFYMNLGIKFGNAFDELEPFANLK